MGSMDAARRAGMKPATAAQKLITSISPVRDSKGLDGGFFLTWIVHV